MTRKLPPFRYFLYVLGTVNAVMAVIWLGLAMVFNGGINAISIGFVLVVVNVVSLVTVARQNRGS
jgi:hypothetical protein